MYFSNRAQAGRLLAKGLAGYSSSNTAIIALNEGSIIVGAQIAMQLHTSLYLFLIENIYLPGENDPLAGLSSTDTFMFNNMFSAGQLEEMSMEFHGFIDQQRMVKRHELNMLLGDEGAIKKRMIRHHNVILVSDGLANGMSIDLAATYLKTIAIKRLIIATATASVNAVDRMHLIADEIHCLSVKDNFMGVNHYYDDNTIPNTDGVMKIIRNIAMNWKRYS